MPVSIAPSSQDTPDTPSIAYNRMLPDWELLQAFHGGTRKVREGDVSWLPKETRELRRRYEVRKNRSQIFGAVRDTVRRIVSRPFSKPVGFRGTEPPDAKTLMADADLQGTNLTWFARSLFRDAVIYGKSHFLVDMPTTGGMLTLGEERNKNVRPYFVHIPAMSMRAWRFGQWPDGSIGPIMIRWMHTAVEPAGEYGEQEVAYVRQWKAPQGQEPGTIKVWRRAPKQDSFLPLGDEMPHTYPGIPIVVLNLDEGGTMMETEPPLVDMAWTELAHYQSDSDQRNITHVARVPILYWRGASASEIKKGIQVGGSEVTATTNKDALLDYVEHSGKAIEAGRQEVRDLEERMEVLGLRVQVERRGNVTATGVAVDEGKGESNVVAWVRGIEGALLQGFEHAARWRGSELADNFFVDVHSEFAMSGRVAEDIKALIQMRKDREITRETFLAEVKRRGLLAEAVEVDAEIEALEEEGGDLAAMIPAVPPPPPSGESEDEEGDEDEEPVVEEE